MYIMFGDHLIGSFSIQSPILTEVIDSTPLVFSKNRNAVNLHDIEYINTSYYQPLWIFPGCGSFVNELTFYFCANFVQRYLEIVLEIELIFCWMEK